MDLVEGDGRAEGLAEMLGLEAEAGGVGQTGGHGGLLSGKGPPRGAGRPGDHIMTGM